MRRIWTLISVLTLGFLTGIPVAHTAAPYLAASERHAGGSGATAAKIGTYLRRLATNAQFTGAVLVARKGRVLLAKGYGLADRENKVPYSPTTKFTFVGFTTIASIVAGLRLEAQGKLHDSDSACSYLPSCPTSWKAMTIRMVLDGTSGLPNVDWGGVKGKTVEDTLANCQSQQITSPDPALSYGNCNPLVLGFIFEKATGKSWAAVMKQTIFDSAGMKNTGRITDGLQPPARAKAYFGSQPNEQVTFNDYFFLYTTARDVYAFDNALFGGKLLTGSVLHRLITPRVALHPPDPHLGSAHRAYGWKVSSAFGHPLVYTSQDNATNLRFPKDGATVVVVTNDT